MFRLSARSKKNLEGVHEDLVATVNQAIKITPVDFFVVEGRRTIERQRKLLQMGATRILNSKHLTGLAVDLAPMVDGNARWDWPLFYPIATAMKQAALIVGSEIAWGGDWKTFKDGPHFELISFSKK